MKKPSFRQILLSDLSFNKMANEGWMLLFMFIPLFLISQEEFSENDLIGMPDDTIKVNRLLLLGKQYCSVENDKALGYLQEAFTISTSTNYDKGVGRSLMWQGRVYYYKDEYTLANKYFDLAESEIINLNDSDSQILLHFFRGEVCKLRGDYINALSNYKKVLDITTVTPNKKISSTSYVAFGNILMSRNEPRKALEYFREGLRQKEEIDDQFGIACVLGQFGEAYEMLEEYDSALYFYKQSLEIRERLNISRVIASSKYAIGGLLIKIGRYNEALDFIKDANQRFAALDDKTGICITNYRLAKALSFLGKPEGIELAIKTQSNAIAINNPKLISMGYQVLSELYLYNEQFKEAHQCLILHKHLEDSLFSAEKERFLVEFEQKFQLGQKDNKIAILKNEGELQRQNILLLSMASFTLLAILILLIILFRFKSSALKKNALLREQENVIHAQESKIKENENQILHEQLEAKNRELASKALEMIRHNDNISSILKELDEINRNPDIGDEASKHIRGIINELDSTSKQNIWSEFDKIFKNIHSGFYTRLLERCPDLTPSEIKTAALLKLNLSTKEIAAITFKSEGGVKTTRYRLRKKLGLSATDKLIPFLIQI